MDTKELVERLNDLIDYLGVPSVHEDEIATVGTAIATIARLERERDEAEAQIVSAREECPLARRQDYFDTPLPALVAAQVSELFGWQSRAEAAESELTTLRARVAKMEKALKRISRSHDCGCAPCVGQWRSQVTLVIANEGMRETAREALTEEPAS